MTREIKQVMKERKAKIGVGMSEGACLGNEVEHSLAVGRCREINDYLDMRYEDLKRGE